MQPLKVDLTFVTAGHSRNDLEQLKKMFDSLLERQTAPPTYLLLHMALVVGVARTMKVLQNVQVATEQELLDGQDGGLLALRTGPAFVARYPMAKP